VRWIVDTSAWARRGQTGVAAQIAAILDEEASSDLVLAPPVLLELLRAPHGPGVAIERAALTETMATLAISGATFALAANAMQVLALHGTDAHRLPLADLLCAALAHQNGCGVIHADGDYDHLAVHAGLRFPHRRLTALDASPASTRAARQRTLRRELARALHRMPVDAAEALLGRAVAEARAAVDDRDA
jgi:predicted nucleic acid-binding protein